MKKTLVALAALASVSAFAQSTVEIYGTLDIGQVKLSGQQAGLNNTTNTYPVSQASTTLANTFARQGTGTNNIGFRGREDLGGGMFAGFDLQTGGLDTSNGNPALAFSRESNLQIGSSSTGTLKLGRSVATVCSVACSFDYNYIGSGSAGGMTGLSGATFYGSSRRSDQIEFKTVDMGGFTGYASVVQRGDMNADGTFASSAGAAYTTTSSVNGTSTTAGDYRNRYSLGGVYVNGPLRLMGVIETPNVNSAAVRTGSIFGAEYNFGMFTANVISVINPNKAIYTSDAGAAVSKVGAYSLTNANTTPTTYGSGTVIAVKMPVGQATFGFQYANNSDTLVKATELFGQYSLSKRTTLYTYYTKLSGAASISASTAAYADGTTTAKLAVGVGAISADPSIFAFGLRHTF
jgi:hypothetical protein